MRSPRAGIVVGLIGLVLLGAGWWLAAVGLAGPVHSPHALSGLGRAPAPLLRQLQQYLDRNSPPLGPRRRPLSTPPATAQIHGTTCAVAAGSFCSLTPCVVYANRASAVLAEPNVAATAPVRPTRRCQGHAPRPPALLVGGI
jgi:hypothetical protein